MEDHVLKDDVGCFLLLVLMKMSVQCEMILKTCITLLTFQGHYTIIDVEENKG